MANKSKVSFWRKKARVSTVLLALFLLLLPLNVLEATTNLLGWSIHGIFLFSLIILGVFIADNLGATKSLSQNIYYRIYIILNLIILSFSLNFALLYALGWLYSITEIILISANFYLLKKFLSKAIRISLRQIIKNKYFRIAFVIMILFASYEFYNYYAFRAPGISINSLTFNKKNNTYTMVATVGTLENMKNVYWLILMGGYSHDCKEIFFSEYSPVLNTQPLDGRFDYSVEKVKIIINSSEINLSKADGVCAIIDTTGQGSYTFLTKIINFTA